MTDDEMDGALAEWASTRSPVETQDPIWGLVTYRFARFAAELAKADAKTLPPHRADIGNQLLRAAASVAANIAEGYSRPTAPDRSRFYGYALGSAREAAAWYAALENNPLSTETALARVAILGRLRRLLFGMLKAARSRRGGVRFDP